MKKILLIIVLLLIPQMLWAVGSQETSNWDGATKEGEYLMPRSLAVFCNVELDAIGDDDSLITTCLEKLQNDRQYDKRGIREISDNVLQEYFVYAVATSSKNKLLASKFQPEVVIREASAGDNADEDSEVNDNINQISFTLRDGARQMSSFLQQYGSVLATNSFRVYHESAIIDAPIVYDEEKAVNPFEEEFAPVPEFYEEEIDDGILDLEVPSEYEKLAPNCGSYEQEAIETNTDVSKILYECFIERRDNLAESITNRYEKEMEEIAELQADYKDEYDRYSAKAEEKSANTRAEYEEKLAALDAEIAKASQEVESKEQQLRDEIAKAEEELENIRNLIGYSQSDITRVEIKLRQLNEDLGSVATLIRMQTEDLARERSAIEKEMADAIEEDEEDILLERDVVAKDRERTIYSKTQDLQSWYDYELGKIEDIILGGG